jgi:hypothetical protein
MYTIAMTNTYIIHYRQPHDSDAVKTITVTAGTLQLAIRQFELKFHDSFIVDVETQENE